LDLADLFRKQALDPLDQLLTDPRHDLVGLDGNGDVMDEVDQHPEADKREQHADGDRQVGDEKRLFRAPDGAQDQQAETRSWNEDCPSIGEAAISPIGEAAISRCHIRLEEQPAHLRKHHAQYTLTAIDCFAHCRRRNVLWLRAFFLRAWSPIRAAVK
jgi:hypothetical protein